MNIFRWIKGYMWKSQEKSIEEVLFEISALTEGLSTLYDRSPICTTNSLG